MAPKESVQSATNGNGTDIAIPEELHGTLVAGDVGISPADLKGLTDFKSAVALATAVANSKGREILHAADMGDGFTKLDDKSKLVGKAFLIVTANPRTYEADEDGGDNTRGVTLRIVTERGDKLIFSGGRSILEQLELEFGAGLETFIPIIVSSGLRAWTRKPINPDGSSVMDNKGKVVTTATTYYLSNEV